MTRCETCGRKRPTYEVLTEASERIYLCAACIELRVVRDD